MAHNSKSAAEGAPASIPRSQRRPSAADGVVIIDKPAGWTSHDVVSKMRGIAATRKVGHAGTLDPMATGVLVVGIGKATRLLNYIVGADKDYDATIRLGYATTTEDAEGEVTDVAAPQHLERVEFESAAAQLTGDLMQVPSSVSAIKVDGKRAYDRVRAGEDVQLAARPVRVEKFDIIDYRAQSTDVGEVIDVDVRVSVSSGTYVRALGRDFARLLGTHGHLTRLRRTRVGGYGLDQARSLEQLAAELENSETISVLPLAGAAAATFAVRSISATEAIDLGCGKRLRSAVQGSGSAEHPVTMAAIDPAGELIALLQDNGMRAQPTVVFAPRQ